MLGCDLISEKKISSNRMLTVSIFCFVWIWFHFIACYYIYHIKLIIELQQKIETIVVFPPAQSIIMDFTFLSFKFSHPTLLFASLYIIIPHFCTISYVTILYFCLFDGFFFGNFFSLNSCQSSSLVWGQPHNLSNK